MAVDMFKQKLITKEEAVTRVKPEQLDELLHPILEAAAEVNAVRIAKGLPAGPGGATGQVVFSANDAVEWAKNGKQVVLVREETNPEDIEGMRAAEAILTARGGMTSHAALVARGWGKCCIVGAGTIDVDAENPTLVEFLKICDKVRVLKIRTNADTPDDAAKARSFGAEGIGLFRTEHMFYGTGSDQALFLLRKMIMSDTEVERRKVLDELFPHVKEDIKGTLLAMDGFPVTIRTLDPPLHEFVPENPEQREKLAESLGISFEDFNARADKLHENNPMLGHRGVRLGITYPEITEMQVRAILEATAELLQEGKKPFPEIMIPVVGMELELKNQYEIVKKVYGEVLEKFGMKKIAHLIGTMIEIPRAAITADKIAEYAQFFSFGTNDMTQMTFGFSRDDIGSFLPEYLKKKLLPVDPFQVIDRAGVGRLMTVGVERGRKVRPDLKVGICGEHGGEPNSIEFCHMLGLNYVSCSPFRVPIARLSAARSAVEFKYGGIFTPEKKK
jgi:pyruvate,orthophosphate dikinase